jgi:protocatechuate 3,4-dioxygenase beta subunit
MLAAQAPEPSAKSSAPAQPPAQPTQRTLPAATGSITGHVTLGDSQLPARMAFVTLLPVTAADAKEKTPAVSSATVQTGLDGSYVMNNILPGAYYVVAGKLGYATTVPMPYLDPDAYAGAPSEVKQALAALVSPTVVAANRASRADIVLQRGAVISGTVRFDDGEPDSMARVSLLHREKSGQWTEFTAQEDLLSFSTGGGASTDDQGNFRLTGLPPGDYLLRTTLALQADEVKTPGAEPAGDPDYRWDIYFGDGIRPRDAKTIKLNDGQESNGNIIEIPLARLHSIAGTVLNLETGAPVTRADVELHNADDDSICTVTAISQTTGQFHFPYVAEGEYTLKVRNAADMAPGARQVFTPLEAGQAGVSDAKPIRSYADASQPLIVKGETSGITIQLKPLPATVPSAP